MSGCFVHVSVSLHSYKAQLLDASETFTMRVYIATIKKEIISGVFVYYRPITNQLLIISRSHTWLLYVANVSILEKSKIVPTSRYFGTFREIDAAFRAEQ